jgi:hypothetical protein
MSYKKHFCTFADSRLQRSLNRIEKQASEMEVYDNIFIYDENKLDKTFRDKFKEKLIKGSRGYGYWSWKPQVILQTLSQVNDGDVIQYSDSGCHLNRNGKERLLKYFDLAKNSKNGILSFRSKNAEELKEGEKFYGNLEFKYNKSDLLNHLGVLNNIDITHTIQYEAGIIFIRKDAETVKFVERWIKVFSDGFNFIDDTPSIIPNLEGFIDHRHDQSIYSILCKLTGVEHLYSSEYYTDADWNTLEKFPIWVKRDMNFGFWQKSKKRIFKVLYYLKMNFLKLFKF